MKIPGLTASSIESYAAEGSYERGREYVDSGAVISVRRTGPGHVEAHVKGGHMMPYTVVVRHDDQGVSEVECSCPYFAGGWCKHIVAVLLAYLDGEYDLEGSELLVRLMQGLSRDEVVSLLQSVAQDHPEIATWVRDAQSRSGDD
ncbi:MAG: SWIM zinc finger family protein [Rhodothermia bacterium]|nr:SWIM zinc finger family protein [Rhodothermia bacterium]